MWHLKKPIFYTQHFFEMRNSEFGISEFRIRISEFGIRNSEFGIEKLMDHKILVTKSVEYTLQ